MCDAPKCYTDKKVRARKLHRCCECRGLIHKGEEYWRFSGIWDEPGTYKTCPECQMLRGYFVRMGAMYEPKAFEELYDDVIESRASHPEFVDYFMRTRVRRGLANDRMEKEWDDALLAMDIHPSIPEPLRNELVDAIVTQLCASTDQPAWPNDRKPCLDAAEALRFKLKTGITRAI